MLFHNSSILLSSKSTVQNILLYQINPIPTSHSVNYFSSSSNSLRFVPHSYWLSASSSAQSNSSFSVPMLAQTLCGLWYHQKTAKNACLSIVFDNRMSQQQKAPPRRTESLPVHNNGGIVCTLDWNICGRR